MKTTLDVIRDLATQPGAVWAGPHDADQDPDEPVFISLKPARPTRPVSTTPPTGRVYRVGGVQICR